MDEFTTPFEYPVNYRAKEFLIGILVIAALFLAGSCTAINRYLGLPDDNIIEEVVEGAVEDVIKDELGIDVDLDFTPGE